MSKKKKSVEEHNNTYYGHSFDDRFSNYAEQFGVFNNHPGSEERQSLHALARQCVNDEYLHEIHSMLLQMCNKLNIKLEEN